MADRIKIFGDTAVVLYLYEIPDMRLGLLQPKTLKERFFKWSHKRLFAKALKRAGAIVCSSKATAEDVKRVYGVAPDKVSVVPAAVDPVFYQSGHGDTLNGKLPQAPFVLHFTTGDPRDNTAVALKAFAHFAKQSKGPHHLVLAGGGSTKEAVTQLIRSSGIEDRTMVLGFLPDTAMPEVYQKAWCYLDPSLFEGFGMQVVEAQASGCPVVAANNSSLPEVAGEGALLYKETDWEGMAAGLDLLLEAQNHEAQVQRGQKQAAQFAWEKTAHALLEATAEQTRALLNR